MQLTDAEIRQILIQQKKKKKQRQKMRRRITLLAVLILMIVLAVIIVYQKNIIENEPPRGIVFIDPGHGGPDPGANNGKRLEKDDTLALSLALKDCLEDLRFDVRMSRTSDEDVDRSRRGEMANECGAQLMISVHRNQVDGDGSGVEGFIPKENSAESRLLGENIMNALAEQGFVKRSIRAGTLKDPDDDYAENAAAAMPAVLIEVGFISSDGDNALFDDNMDGNAHAIANAISDTFHTLYEPDEETVTD